MAQKKNITGIKFEEQELKAYLETKVREAVVDVVEAVLDAEAQEMVRARPYERTEQRQDVRNGKRKRKLVTRVGEVELQVPRLRTIPFQSQIIERYRRMETSLEEALVEMYIQGVSTRRVTDITEALCDVSVTPGRMSGLNKKVYGKLEAWRQRPLGQRYCYLYLDGTVVKVRIGDHVESISILVAIGVTLDGHREVLGVEPGCREDEAGWLRFLRQLKERGLKTVGLVISDAHPGLVEAAQHCFPNADYQRCIFHFMGNVLTQVPPRMRKRIALELKTIYAQEDAEEARRKANRLAKKYQKLLPQAVKILEKGIEETLTFYRYPQAHQSCIRTNNPLERLLREIKRRIKVVGVFPHVDSAMMLATARLKYVQDSRWSQRIYLNMKQFEDAA